MITKLPARITHTVSPAHPSPEVGRALRSAPSGNTSSPPLCYEISPSLRGENSSLSAPSAPPLRSLRDSSFFSLRPYQQEAFENRTHGLEVWLWGRQTGKSFTLAAWAVDRLLNCPGRLVTILSNSRANGMELNLKCGEICRALAETFEQQDLSGDLRFETMNYETRITTQGRTGRIKVLPANPRTARGFSGDLILDEFAFHENSAAIWEAAEPILSANPDYLCRIASTPNGRRNKFYQMVTDEKIPVRKVPRSLAHAQGLPIYHPITRAPITPEEARELAQDKRAYDQNYECIFESENMALLTMDLISQAEDAAVGVVCDGEWSPEVVAFLRGEIDVPIRRDEFHESSPEVGRALRSAPSGESPCPPSLRGENSSFALRNLYVGVDVGRTQDLTVITILEKTSGLCYVRAMLRLRNLRLPEQQAMLDLACRSPRFAAAQIDMTGLGLGLFEYTQKAFGSRVRGLNFASSLPLDSGPIRNPRFEIRNVKAPEVLALRLLQIYEARRIRHPVDAQLREDLRQPERVTAADGRASIVSARTDAGHADHFWSLALAVDASQRQPDIYIHVPMNIRPRPFLEIDRNILVM